MFTADDIVDDLVGPVVGSDGDGGRGGGLPGGVVFVGVVFGSLVHPWSGRHVCELTIVGLSPRSSLSPCWYLGNSPPPTLAPHNTRGSLCEGEGEGKGLWGHIHI